jgi:hypothetical protein
MTKTGDQNGLPVQQEKMLEVVGILEVFSKHDVADIKQSGQLRDGGVPYAPGALKFIGQASIKDKAEPRVRGLVNSTQGLDEERGGAAGRDHLDDALPNPCGEFGAEGYLGCLVLLPAGVVGAPRGAQCEAVFGHVEAALDDHGGRGVERAEAPVPSRGGAEDGGQVARGALPQPNVGREEAGGEGLSAGGEDQALGWRERPRAERVGAGHSDQSGRREEEGKGLGGVRFGEFDVVRR